MVFDMANNPKKISVRTYNIDYLADKNGFYKDAVASLRDLNNSMGLALQDRRAESRARYEQRWENLTDAGRKKWKAGKGSYVNHKVNQNLPKFRRRTWSHLARQIIPAIESIQKEAERLEKADKNNLRNTPAYQMRYGTALRRSIDALGAILTDNSRNSPLVRYNNFMREAFNDAPLKNLKTVEGIRNLPKTPYNNGAYTASVGAQEGITQDEIDTVLALYETAPDIYHEEAAKILERGQVEHATPAKVRLPIESVLTKSADTTEKTNKYLNKLFGQISQHGQGAGLTPSGSVYYSMSGPMHTPSFPPHSVFGLGNSNIPPISPKQMTLSPFVVDPEDLMRGRNRRAERRATASMAGFNASNFFRQNIGTARIGNWFNQLHGPRRMARNATANLAYSGAAQWFQDHENTMRKGTWIPPEEEKAIDKISKVLPSLVRPLINLIKSLGSMAAESAKATQAMSVLSSAIGNPFEEGTLAGITEWGSSFGGMSGSFISGVGGMLGGVGEGVGRMANNAMLGDKADVNTNATKGGKGTGIGKAAGVFSAITGIVGAYLGGVGQSISAGWSIANGLLRSINKATLKIMDTSPIFKTIKDLLNLSFTMVFLPAMTLLQGKMLPIFVDLLNKAVVFGQQFAQEFLPYIPGLVADFQAVVNDVVDFFANNKTQLAEMIAGMIGLLPDMMKMQLGLIKLFVDNKDKILEVANKTIDVLSTFIDKKLLDAVLGLADATLEFMKDWGVPLAKATMALAKFFVRSFDVITGGDIDHSYNDQATEQFAKGDYLGGLATTGKGMLNVLTLGQLHLASGGYVPATPGGVPAIIGEGEEGEYVIPESKLNSIGGLTIVFSGNVYGMNDFKQQVRSIMNEYTTKANFR